MYLSQIILLYKFPVKLTNEKEQICFERPYYYYEATLSYQDVEITISVTTHARTHACAHTHTWSDGGFRGKLCVKFLSHTHIQTLALSHSLSLSLSHSYSLIPTLLLTPTFSHSLTPTLSHSHSMGKWKKSSSSVSYVS